MVTRWLNIHTEHRRDAITGYKEEIIVVLIYLK
jgi:hypothetical protein